MTVDGGACRALQNSLRSSSSQGQLQGPPHNGYSSVKVLQAVPTTAALSLALPSRVYLYGTLVKLSFGGVCSPSQKSTSFATAEPVSSLSLLQREFDPGEDRALDENRGAHAGVHTSVGKVVVGVEDVSSAKTIPKGDGS
ncbi:hypothetical protein DOTSEDRAFT_79177 [Dothistroma septosporum NZE10]|uniref:Uncharacterized protein n=1 Tax=Dothistroma septosporum (strain NZE10 / CBS 128990) TaxID=675120 RepID=N1PNP7_DOTSN|nr:hypothetical protein DOTSEDRAFT_79177 [Dothistroma septosporum NZE10]